MTDLLIETLVEPALLRFAVCDCLMDLKMINCPLLTTKYQPFDKSSQGEVNCENTFDVRQQLASV